MAAATPVQYHRRRKLNLKKQKNPSKGETAAIAIGGFSEYCHI
jgi:hypothetical protein